MKAKLKKDYRWGSVQIGGVEIVKGEFRELPDALFELNKKILLSDAPAPVVVEEPKVEVKQEVIPEPKVEEVLPEPEQPSLETIRNEGYTSNKKNRHSKLSSEV